LRTNDESRQPTGAVTAGTGNDTVQVMTVTEALTEAQYSLFNEADKDVEANKTRTAVEYASFTKTLLMLILRRRLLSYSGNKQKLADRLLENDLGRGVAYLPNPPQM